MTRSVLMFFVHLFCFLVWKIRWRFFWMWMWWSGYLRWEERGELNKNSITFIYILSFFILLSLWNGPKHEAKSRIGKIWHILKAWITILDNMHNRKSQLYSLMSHYDNKSYHCRYCLMTEQKKYKTSVLPSGKIVQGN